MQFGLFFLAQMFCSCVDNCYCYYYSIVGSRAIMCPRKWETKVFCATTCHKVEGKLIQQARRRKKSLIQQCEVACPLWSQTNSHTVRVGDSVSVRILRSEWWLLPLWMVFIIIVCTWERQTFSTKLQRLAPDLISQERISCQRRNQREWKRKT